MNREQRRGDLTGLRFGHLTVLRRGRAQVSPSGNKHSTWICRCDCGHEKVVLATNLRNGNTRSCGQCDLITQFDDLTGLRFGHLIALRRVDDHVTSGGHRQVSWECACDCGEMTIVTAGALRSGHKKTCGKCNLVKRTDFVDLVGKRFGHLTVLRRVDNHVSTGGNSFVTWECVCDCGNLKTVVGNHLSSGHTLSCGKCGAYDHSADFTGKKVGFLTVLRRADDWYTYPNGDRDFKWICRCDCGNLVTVRGNALRSQSSLLSCGCKQKSKWEIWLMEFLNENHVSYTPQKRYADLRGLNGGCLSYDFCLHLDNGDVLVECQGLQHYVSIEYFGGDAGFESRLEHDRRKREYAVQNGLVLIELDCSNGNMSHDDYVSMLKNVFGDYFAV